MESKDNLYSIPESTIHWLLSSQTPSLRYFTHKLVLGRADDDPSIISTRAQIAQADYVQAIISAQDAEGYWYSARHYYGPKFRGTHWSMLLLSELGVPPDFEPMQIGARFMLKRMETFKGVYHTVPSIYEAESSGFSCFWGNWLRYQIYCKNLEHPLVQQAISFVCRDVQRSGRCEYNYDLPCAWGLIRSLFGLALIPYEQRDTEITDAIEHGIQFILTQFNLVEANYPNRDGIHTSWHKLSFPLFYHTDILFTLRVLGKLNALNQPRAKEALDWLDSKRKKDGAWRGASPFKNRSHPFLTPPDTPSRWVTLHALSVLASANRQNAE